MGNEMSAEEEAEFLEEGFNLDSPEADQAINYGTAAPIWQNRKEAPMDDSNGEANIEDGAVNAETNAEASAAAAGAAGPDSQPGVPPRDKSNPLSPKHRRNSSGVDSASSNSQHSAKRQHAMSEPKKLSYIQMAKLGYQELVNAIIRPPRADYKMEALGPPAFTFCNRRFTRTDFTLRTKRGYNLECSHWEPVERTTDRIPVVIYMHGNSSARVEVIPQLSYLLSLGLAVFAFDFAGSGKSDGDFVSLGYYEREDLSCVVAHLRATTVVSKIALWGRSMGAATSVMFGDRDPTIACMILDSSFADLTQLCEELVEKGREQGIVVPSFVVNMTIRMLQGSVKKQAGFSLKQISPIAHCERCFIPALFVAGEHDEFIKKHHSEQLYEKYAGDKNLIIVEGDHNSPRPKFMFDSASIFLQACLQIPNSWALEVPVSMNLMCPPWYFELYQQRAQRKASAVNGKYHGGGSSSTAAAGGAAARNGYNHDEMGMTAERQRVIQASLFKMLGQADDAPPPAAPAAATKNAAMTAAPATTTVDAAVNAAAATTAVPAFVAAPPTTAPPPSAAAAATPTLVSDMPAASAAAAAAVNSQVDTTVSPSSASAMDDAQREE